MKSRFIVLFLFLCSYTFAQQNLFYITIPGFENKHWIFSGEQDTLSGSWSYLQQLPAPMLGINSYYWPESNKVLLCGGIDSNLVAQSSFYAYDPVLNSYQSIAPLPMGRWSGKLVRVRDSLYLVGSIGSNFAAPDGKIFRYSLNTNSWITKSIMPVPFLHESAVIVYKDSLIVTIGGSSNGFIAATQTIRVYNPWTDLWTTSGSAYPVPVTTAHAESVLLNDTAVVVVCGGYGNGPLDLFKKGSVNMSSTVRDSVMISWDTSSYTPFDGGIYRLSGCKWNDWMIFGPGIRNATNISQMYGLRLYKVNDTLVTYWTKFVPDIIDTMANIPQIAVKNGADTSWFFFAGGYNASVSPYYSNHLRMFSVAGHPPPIGIHPVSQTVPTTFQLYQNYPNPFNPKTRIEFSIPVSQGSQFVTLSVYDVLGREVAVLLREKLQTGTYRVDFDGTSLSSGIYFYVLKAMGLIEARKMVLIK